MDGTQATASDLASVEATLRDGLARGDAVLSAATPTLRRLLAYRDEALLNDEVVARVRGMLHDLARQVLEAQDGPAITAEDLVAALADDSVLLSHVHALAVEGRLAERLEAEAGIDPVLSPLLEQLIAAGDEVVAGAAMAAMAAQASFIQNQRRMTLPIAELPADLLRSVIAAWCGTIADPGRAEAAEAALRRGVGEDPARFDLLTRLVMRTGSNASGALDVATAGLAVFATALALAAGQARDVTVLSLAGPQSGRLVLALRAAGLTPAAVGAQFVLFHRDASPGEDVSGLRADRATAVLATVNPPRRG